MVSGVGRGMGVLDGSGDHQRGRDSFGGEFGASHFNHSLYMDTILSWWLSVV